MFVKVNLSDGSLSEPGALPAELTGLNAESLRDLSWTDPALGFHDYSYLPVKYEYASLQPGEIHGDPESPVSDGNAIIINVPSIVAPVSDAESVVLTKVEFMDRFSFEEQIKIYTAAKLLPAVEVFLDKLKMAEEVRMDDPNLALGIDILVSEELITQDRANLILET